MGIVYLQYFLFLFRPVLTFHSPSLFVLENVIEILLIIVVNLEKIMINCFIVEINYTIILLRDF